MADDDKVTFTWVPGEKRVDWAAVEREALERANLAFYGDTTPGALHFYTPSDRFRGWLADCLRDIADWIDG